MSALDLAEFVALPGLPGYLIRRDGRVCSLKKAEPHLLVEQVGAREQLRTVRIQGHDVRVRDLAYVMFGRVAS